MTAFGGPASVSRNSAWKTGLLLLGWLCLGPGEGEGRAGEGAGKSLPHLPGVSLSSGIDVRADQFHADARSGEGEFSGNVVATLSDLTLLCERLRVRYDRGRGDVREVEAQGGVRLKLGERHGRADNIVYDVVNGSILLKGAPSLQDGDTLLQGEEIRIQVSSRTVECRKCRVTWSGTPSPGNGEKGR